MINSARSLGLPCTMYYQREAIVFTRHNEVSRCIMIAPIYEIPTFIILYHSM